MLALAVLVAVARAVAGLLPYWLRDDRFVGDAAQHVWWLYRWVDPRLFPGDAAARYYALSAFSPVGYQALVRASVAWADPQRATEMLAAVLAVAAVALAAALGYRVGEKTGAVAALAVLVAAHGERAAEGGFPRSFALVLVLGGMLAVLHRRWPVLAGVFVLAALLYAPVLLNLAPVTLVTLGVGVVRHRRLPRGAVAFAALSAVAVGLIAMTYLRPPPPEFGHWFSHDALRRLPEWQPGGRNPYFLPWADFFFGAPASGIGLRPSLAMTLGDCWC